MRIATVVLVCALLLAVGLWLARPTARPPRPDFVGTPTTGRVANTDADWKALLSPESYRVARQGGTEPPFRNAYWDHHETGVYHCVACDEPLFASATKYDSGTGWPSFFDPVRPEAVALVPETGLFDTRTEVRCRTCDSHLGHVFDDGPRPTGKRYCMNSAALKFAKE